MKNKGIVKIATVQPPIPEGEKGGKVSHQAMVEKGLYFLEKAGRRKVDAVCLPEVFNVFGLSEEESIEKASQPDKIRKKIMRLSSSFKMYTIYTGFEKKG